MKALESGVRSIEIDGLTWGGSKLVPLAFGINKLQVNLVVEDEKVSIDDLQERIASDEDHVQSSDVVSHFLRDCIGCVANEFGHPDCYAKAVDFLICLCKLALRIRHFLGNDAQYCMNNRFKLVVLQSHE